MFGKKNGLFKVLSAVTLMFAMTAGSVADASHPDSKRFSFNITQSAATKTHSKRSRTKKQKARKVAYKRPQQQIGALVMTESGEIVMDSLSDSEFNPASVAKVVTAYGAMKVFGLQHQFSTTISCQGQLNEATGVFTGDIYITGNDPDFERSDAVALYQELEYAGVKQVNGRLVISGGFSYCSVSDPLWSGRSLTRSWNRGKKSRIIFRKGVAVGTAPDTALVLADLKSEPLRDTLKEMLSYSQNNVAEQIGRVAGGLRNIEDIVTREAGLGANALKLVTASGLGKNRLKPKDMMAVLKALRTDLRSQNLDFQDILPVAGIDEGTLDERFTGPLERGSVVGKTGSLPGTDGGTSALVGMFRSQREDFYFVIFCWRGNVPGFRNQQDNLIRQIQATRGGPKPYDYRLAKEDGA